MMSLMRRLKQKGVLCGTEYLDKRCDGLTSFTGDDALHKYQRTSGATQYFFSTCLHLWSSSFVQRFKQNGVLCGTEYIDKRYDRDKWRHPHTPITPLIEVLGVAINTCVP